MIHCKICGAIIGGGLYCRDCAIDMARQAEKVGSGCTCARQGDFEDVRGCDVHDPRKQRSWNDD